MIKKLLNSVIAKYRDLSVSRRSIIQQLICLPQTNHNILLKVNYFNLKVLITYT